MATRFYLPSSGSADVSPTISATDWAHINSVRRKMSPIKANSSFAATTYTPDAADHIVAAKSHFVQFVSDVLAPQTIAAQTVSLAMLNLESNAGNNCFLNWKVYAVPEDGSSVLGTLVALRADATEMGTTQINRTDSVTSTQFIGATTFRLVFEIGIGGTPVATSQVQGHNGTIRFGDPTGGADLAANDTATTDAAPWINFATTTMIFQIPVALSGTQAQSGSSTATRVTTMDSTVSLVQGTTVIASWSDNALSTSFQTFEHILSGAEADAITNYGDLRIRFSATGQSTWEEVSWAEMQLPAAPAGTTNNVSLSGTQAQAGAIVRSVGHPRSVTQAQSGTLSKSISHKPSGTQAQSGTRVISTSRPRSGTQAQSGSVTATFQAGVIQTPRAVSGTQAQAGTVTRTITHALSGTQAQTGTIARAISRPRAGTQVQSGTRAISRATVRSITQAQAGTTTKIAVHGLTLSGTQAQAGTAVKVTAHLLTLSGTQAQSSTESHLVPQQRSAAGTQAQVGALTHVVSHATAGTQAQLDTKIRTVIRLLSRDQAQSGTRALSRAVSQSATQAQAGTTIKTAAHKLTLSGTQAQASTESHVVPQQRIISGTQAQSGSILIKKAQGVILAGSQSQAGTISRALTHVIAGTQPQSGTYTRSVSQSRTGTQAQVAIRLSGVSHVCEAIQDQLGTVIRLLSKSQSGSQAQLGTTTTFTATITPRPLAGTQAQEASCVVVRIPVTIGVLQYYGVISCPIDITESLVCPQDLLGSISCPLDFTEDLRCPQDFTGSISCGLDFLAVIGVNPLSKPIANSTNQFQMTLVAAGVRVTDATVELTVTAPDGVTKTLEGADVPHTSNGVYLLKTAPSVVPKKGPGYQAVFTITRGTDIFNPKYYFEVYEN